MQILLIEDDKDAAADLVKGLRERGYCTDHATDGASGLALALEPKYDLLIVDRLLPEMDGLALVERLRERGVATPVLFLTALSEVDDRVAGLNAGGDDYLPKPFAFAELLARIEVLVRRRRPSEAETVLKVGNLELDRLKRTARRGARPILLQPREFRLLEYFMLHAGEIVTRTMLLEQVWGFHFDPQTNVIDVHVSRLRAKIDADFAHPILHTVRGAGYRLSENSNIRETP